MTRAEWTDYFVRPGSLRNSTTLWWVLPPVIVWAGLVGGAFVAHGLNPTWDLSGPIEWALLVDLTATSLWLLLVLFSQRESDTTLGGGLIDPKGRHEFWRVRTIAWDLLAVAIVGGMLDAFLLAGPSVILPMAAVPIVELAVLVATILLLATFSRYAAMAFNTDAAQMTQKLDEISTRESEARTKDTDRITALFTEQTDRIVARADAQIEATRAGLQVAADRLDRVARAIEDLTKVERESNSAAEAAANAQRRSEEEKQRAAAERRADAIRAAARRIELIRPEIWATVRTQGVIFHRLFVDIYNDGFDGIGLDVTVLVGQARFTFHESKLPSKGTTPFDVTDVSRIPLRATVGVGVDVRDVDGNRYRVAAGPFNYSRELGWFGRTKSISVHPVERVLATPIG